MAAASELTAATTASWTTHRNLSLVTTRLRQIKAKGKCL